MQTFLPYPDLAVSCAVLDDRRLGKQRVEVFQVLRALTWPTYAWKSHPAVRMWRGFVPALVRYGVEACREWSRRGFGDALQEQLLAWSGGTVPEDPALPPWFGAEPLHLSHRSNLLRKDPQHYRPLFAALGSAGEPEDLPYVWPPDVFPHWPLRPGLGLVPRPFQEQARDAVLDGRDVLLVARPGSGGTTAGLLAGLAVPGRTALVVPPLGPPAPPAPPVTGPPPGDRVPGTAAVPLARPPGPEDLAAMAAEAQPSPWAVGTRLPAGPFGLVVLDGADAVDPVPRPAAPVLAVVGQTPDPVALAARHGLRDPLHLGAGWGLDRFLATADGRPRQVVAGEPRPVLVRAADRGAADRLLTALRADGLRVAGWHEGLRGSRAAAAVAAWRSRRLDALVTTGAPPLGRVRPASYVDLTSPEAPVWHARVEASGAPRAVLAPAPGWARGCLHAAVLTAFGAPAPASYGCCSSCTCRSPALASLR